MSTSSSSPPAAPTTSKTRSPVERALVWGVIVVLLGLAGVEYSARSSYDSARETLEEKLGAVDTKEGAKALTEAEVKATVGGKAPDSSDSLKGKNPMNSAARVDVYSWFTLNPFAERRMYVYYGHGDNPEVIAVDSKEVEYHKYDLPQIRGITQEEREHYGDTHDNYGNEIPSKKATAEKRAAARKEKAAKQEAAKVNEEKKEDEKKDDQKKDEEK